MNADYAIRALQVKDIQPAMDLVWRVFSKFEAPEYSQLGIDEFKNYIRYDAIQKRMDEEQLLLWGCFDKYRIVGVIAAKPPGHISLLFVHGQYHRRGIARSLFNQAAQYCKANYGCTVITVNSSPYAKEAYHSLGFRDTDTEQTANGLRFIPMKRPILK